MAGVHIVTRTGGSPGVGALLTRNVFRLVDTLPLLYGVGLVATFATRDHVRVGDMAAGTILVYERPDIVLPEHAAARLPSDRALSSSDTEVITELLMRWAQLESEARRRLALEVLAQHDAGGGSTRIQTDSELRVQLERLLKGTPT
jgi:hypothetical protein